MASLATACRLSARALRTRVVSESAIRGYRTSTRCLAAQNFTMPALSPTMTEGNISAWKVKEGDTFVAGDVLLEIETDKATMDVEAQDDGIVMKIMTGDGAKAVQVGTRIAVVAEQGDDISKLEIPPDENKAAAKEEKGGSKEAESKEEERNKKAAAPKASGEKHQHKYPLFPAVQHLVKQHGLDEAAVEGIKPTGPKGRLLKGDVLAYLGTIDADAPAKNSARYEKNSHLDLSNIKVAAPKKEESKDKKKRAEEDEPVIPQDTEIAVPVSLAKVIEVQKRVHNSIGTFLPLSAFITRAAEVANDELPPKAWGPTSDELFNAVLGLNTVRGPTRGCYVPEIQALPKASFVHSKPSNPDIIDILAGTSKKPTATPPPARSPGISTGSNVFTLVVPKAEEKRASVFLERMKVILEKEPGRLVL